MESYKSLIGKKIQKRRIELGFRTQKDLAAKIGTEQSQVSRWESGGNIPEGALKDALCDVLQVDYDFFEMIDVGQKLDQENLLIRTIVFGLPALNQDQLRGIADLVSNFSEAAAAKSRTSS